MQLKKLLGLSAIVSALLVGQLAHAQAIATTTTGTDQTTTSSSTPGVPNTGAGGDAATTLVVLGTTGIIAVGGITYLSRKLAQKS